ncbi:uncharacterized protein EDB91DRAFT_1248940 [Suillus paluster]|uniref:uncharacterized protein n=1 Tax=Suillus paluster TaxID=48578 RepID=UPI001B865070|nr:uncharacterized protein EDB91DRAFT_1248940 [Suillus paluster]KAG1739185.1 hypothetical protein EDB91DRAFT_1248940 [Suillus paluster]
MIDLEGFTPNRTHDAKFRPVVVEGHNWLDVTEIRYTVFLRGGDGKFYFDSKDSTHIAEGTLFPTVQMDDVDHKLMEGAARLKACTISVMEDLGVEQNKLPLARQFRLELQLNWAAASNQVSSAIYSPLTCAILTGSIQRVFFRTYTRLR